MSVNVGRRAERHTGSPANGSSPVCAFTNAFTLPKTVSSISRPRMSNRA